MTRYAQAQAGKWQRCRASSCRAFAPSKRYECTPAPQPRRPSAPDRPGTSAYTPSRPEREPAQRAPDPVPGSNTSPPTKAPPELPFCPKHLISCALWLLIRMKLGVTRVTAGATLCFAEPPWMVMLHAVQPLPEGL